MAWSDFFKLFKYATGKPPDMGATSVTGVGSAGAFSSNIPGTPLIAPGKTVMSFAADNDLMQEVRLMAREKGVTVSNLMEAMMRKYLAEQGHVQNYVPPPPSGKARSILDDWEVTQDASA